jgi:hypothetical protein
MIIATVTLATLAGCTDRPAPPPAATDPALAPPPPPYLSDVLHLGMTHDEAMDTLQIDEPIDRAACIGDFIRRSWSGVSPRFPRLFIELAEEPSVRGGWIVTQWTVDAGGAFSTPPPPPRPLDR